MSSSFLIRLIAVLSDQDEIENLPNDKLFASDYVGEPLEKYLTQPILRKLARLQTLAFESHDAARLPSVEVAQSIADVTGSNLGLTMGQALEIQEDANWRIMMINRVMVEVIREAIPSEGERNNIEYVCHVSGVVMRRPILRNALD